MARYYLDKEFKQFYLTTRQAECAIGLLQYKKIQRIAYDLSLSVRTVEAYIRNIRKKLKCRNRYDLINRLINSHFIENYLMSKSPLCPVFQNLKTINQITSYKADLDRKDNGNIANYSEDSDEAM